jgi:RimJ/RimL family protein N-acetyltransferase
MRLPEKLITERLILRPHKLDDFEGFFSFLSNPEASLYISFSSEERTREGSLAFFEEILATYETQRPVFGLAIEETSTGSYAGFCGLVNLEHQQGAELYYVLLPEFRRRGYALEAVEALFRYAFQDLKIGRLVCFVAQDNEAGLRTLNLLGMEDEGLTDHDAYPQPVHQFGLWRKNWIGGEE